MKAKLWLFFASLLFALSFAALVSAQTGQTYLNEDFNYSSLDQMQAAGWTFTRPAGISVAASAVTLDGTGGDCAIHHATSFSNDVYDWKAEVRSMWLGQGHSVLSVFVYTERHSYGWAADGYYKEFSFYRDSKKVLHFGIYEEKANQFVVLSLVREGNTFSFYFNGELKNTYIEEDTLPSKVTSLDLVSPWRGDAKYDYYQIGEPNAAFASSAPTGSTNSFPMVPVLVGGGIAAAVVGGIVVYYFFIAGGSSASAGASAGSTGSGGGGPIIQDHPISPLSGEAPPNLSPQALAEIALKYPPETYPQGIDGPGPIIRDPLGNVPGQTPPETYPQGIDGPGLIIRDPLGNVPGQTPPKPESDPIFDIPGLYDTGPSVNYDGTLHEPPKTPPKPETTQTNTSESNKPPQNDTNNETAPPT